MEQDGIPKVVLVGDEGVGKTTLFLRFKEDKFVEVTQHTRYMAEHSKEWTVGGQPVKVYYSVLNASHNNIDSWFYYDLLDFTTLPPLMNSVSLGRRFVQIICVLTLQRCHSNLLNAL